MAYANGRIPSSALAPIPGTSPRPGGHPLLRKDAARAYTALHNYAMKRWRISMALSENSIRRAYREIDAQYLAKRMYGSNAATPGTSNHGLGINVDLMTRQQRWVIDQVGASFGFSKRWSDAAWEWWHITYRSSSYALVAKYAGTSSTYPTLKRGAHGPSVVRLKKYLYAKGMRGFSPNKNGKPSSNRVEPHFGLNCHRTVVRFQKKHHLPADGIVGPSTWRALRR